MQVESLGLVVFLLLDGLLVAANAVTAVTNAGDRDESGHAVRIGRATPFVTLIASRLPKRTRYVATVVVTSRLEVGPLLLSRLSGPQRGAH